MLPARALGRNTQLPQLPAGAGRLWESGRVSTLFARDRETVPGCSSLPLARRIVPGLPGSRTVSTRLLRLGYKCRAGLSPLGARGASGACLCLEVSEQGGVVPAARGLHLNVVLVRLVPTCIVQSALREGPRERPRLPVSSVLLSLALHIHGSMHIRALTASMLCHLLPWTSGVTPVSARAPAAWGCSNSKVLSEPLPLSHFQGAREMPTNMPWVPSQAAFMGRIAFGFSSLRQLPSLLVFPISAEGLSWKTY